MNALRRLALLTAVLLLLAAPPHRVRADEPISLAAYRAVVTQALELAAQAQSHPSAQQELLAQAAERLDAVRDVRLESGTVIAVNNDALLRLMREPTPSLASVRARLAALRDTLGQPTQTMSAEELRQLRSLLDAPPFKSEEDPFARALSQLLSRLLGTTARSIFTLREAIVALGIVLMLALVAYFVWNLRRTTVAEARLNADAADAEAQLTSSAALDNAQRYASAGDYRAAVRQLYLSTLLLLDERGRLRYDRALTNREYLHAVASTPALRDALRPIVETFDRIWYGFAPISSSEFEAYRQQVEMLRSR